MKKYILILFSCFLFVGTISTSAQDSDKPLQPGQIFSDKDKDFMQLWYYSQVLKMDLDEEGRSDYLGLLNYYTYKMRRLSLPRYKYTDEEKKIRFDRLIELLNLDMKEFLSEENYLIHEESFGEIVDNVYKKMEWKE